MAQAPITLEVPLRSPLSCPPPKSSGCTRVPRRRYTKPAPLSAPSLWAEKAAASTPLSSRFIWTLPRACTQSVKKRAPSSWAASASSRTGWMVPSSLFTAITHTSASFPPPAKALAAASSSACGVTMPLRLAGTPWTLKPRRLRLAAASATAWCSMELTMTCVSCGLALAGSRPRTAMLSPSVPPLVKTISAGWRAPTARAMRRRASSSWRRASRPSA